MKIHLPSIANTLGSVLAGKIGLNVNFDAYAETASTDGKSVTLPTFVEYGGDDEAAILRGFLAHEIVGHVRHTDFDAFRAWGSKQSPLGLSVWNIIEDVRIERAAWRVFPGSRRILKNCVAAMVRRGGFFDMPKTENPASVLTAFLLVTLREKELGQPLDHLPFAALATKVFGKNLRNKILAIAAAGTRGTSTLDACKAADQIIALLQQQAEEQPQKSKGQDKKDSGNGKGDNKAQSGSESGQQKESGEHGEQQASGNQTDEKQTESGNSGNNVYSISDHVSSISDQEQKAIQEALGASKDQIGKTDLGSACANVLTSQNTLLPVPVKKISKYQGWRPDLNAMSAARKLGARLELLLQAKTEDEQLLGKCGRLVSKKIARTRVLDLDVFEVEGDEADGLNTAITFLIDRSGSMATATDGISSMDMAKITAAAVGEALSGFETQGIAFSMYAFERRCYLMKAFRDTWREKRETIGSLYDLGGTDFQGTLLAISQEIAKRPEKRKVVFAVTDGDLGRDPAPVIQTMRSQGIEVRAVFIGPNEIMEKIAGSAKLEVWGVAQNPKDIPKAVFKSLEGVF